MTTLKRFLVLACVVLTAGAPLAAQAPRAADPISGTWTGVLTLEGGARGPMPLTLELKLDAKGAVTGTVAGLPTAATVHTGSYDAKTGVMKLAIGKPDEDRVRVTLTGPVVKGVVSGTADIEAGSGTFKFERK